MTGLRLLVTSSLMLAVCSCTGKTAPGDPVQGELLHRDCMSCHGTELYVPPARKLATLPALREEVEKWNDSYNPKMTAQEVENVVAYLNVTFYKFSQ